MPALLRIFTRVSLPSFLGDDAGTSSNYLPCQSVVASVSNAKFPSKPPERLQRHYALLLDMRLRISSCAISPK